MSVFAESGGVDDVIAMSGDSGFMRKSKKSVLGFDQGIDGAPSARIAGTSSPAELLQECGTHEL